MRNSWKNAGVYLITCLHTKRLYVAASENLKVAVVTEKRRLSAGAHPNVELQADFNLHQDTMVYKVLEAVDVEGQDWLEGRARFWMTELGSFTDAGGYNDPEDYLIKPRFSTLKGRKRGSPSEETRKKMSQAAMGRKKKSS
jgi:hypothetical protein